MFWRRRKALIGGNIIFMRGCKCLLVYWLELLWQFLFGLFLHMKEMAVFPSGAVLMANWLPVILDKFLDRLFIYACKASVM